MPDPDLDILSFDYRALTLPQKEAFRRLAISRAEIARSETMRDAFMRLCSGLRTLAAACTGIAADGWKAYRTWRLRCIAEAELRGLDERALRDLGISRSEISSLVWSDDTTRHPRSQPCALLGVGQLTAQIRHQHG